MCVLTGVDHHRAPDAQLPGQLDDGGEILQGLTSRLGALAADKQFLYPFQATPQVQS